MDLNLSQLRTITMGALDIREEADGFHFFRMLPMQTAAFGEANAEFLLKVISFDGADIPAVDENGAGIRIIHS